MPLAPAQDYKRIFDGDEGPNTGGMGSYSPVPGIDAERTREIAAQVHQPIVDELRRRGTPFHGVLYAGLMIAPDGAVKVLEYNARSAIPRPRPCSRGCARICSSCSRRRARPGSGRLGPSGRATGPDGRARLRRLPGVLLDSDVISGLDAVDGADVFHAGTVSAMARWYSGCRGSA